MIVTSQLQDDGKLVFEKKRINGEVVGYTGGNMSNPSTRLKAAKDLGVDLSVILQLSEVDKSNKLVRQLVNIGEDLSLPKVKVRGEFASDGTEYPDWRAALENAKDGQVLEWKDTAGLCVLDIDMPPTEIPTRSQYIASIAQCPTVPACWWVSKSGGCHMVYVAAEGYRADELAAVGYFWASKEWPLSKQELLPRTRRPPGVVHWQDGVSKVEVVRSLLNKTIAVDATEYLERHGYVVGQRYGHERCPMRPTPQSKVNDCVVVYENGITCYVCRAKQYMGGNFPWHVLVRGGQQANRLARCVKGFVHFGHARHSFPDTVHIDIQELIYSCLLKLEHGVDDERIGKAFHCDSRKGVFRSSTGLWKERNGGLLSLEPTSAILGDMPVAWKYHNGRLIRDNKTIEWLSMSHDLGEEGYDGYDTVVGCLLNNPLVFEDRPTPVVVPHKELIDKRSRWPDVAVANYNADDAWTVLDKVFSGVDRRLIELLVIGRGVSEVNKGMPPMLYLNGPTSSGKTSHVELAAAICGDSVGTVQYKRDQQQFMMEVMDAKEGHGLVMCDEFFKAAETAGVRPIQAAQTVLSWHPNLRVKLLYVGPVRFGRLPFVVFADVQTPPEIFADKQVTRRVIYYRLPRSIDWRQTMADAGIGSAKNLRTMGSDELINAANVVLTDIRDRWFASDVPVNFQQAAQDLGFRIMDATDEATVNRVGLLNFYRTLRKAPLLPANMAKANGKTWREVRGELKQALESCQTPQERGGGYCSAFGETDGTDFGLPKPGKYEWKRHAGAGVYLVRWLFNDGTTHAEVEA